MALIKFGPTVVGVRGTVGGLTFSANLASPYIKAWSPPINRRSTRQSDSRATFGNFATSWGGLSQSERDDWDDYANDAAQELTNSLGENYFTSGFSWYIKINTQLTLAGRASRDDAPTATRPAAPTIDGQQLKTTASGGISLVNVDNTDPDFGADVCVKSTYFLTQARGFANFGRQFLRCAQPTAAGALTTTGQIADKYGTISLGSRIFYFVSYQDTQGQRGPSADIQVDASE